MQLEVCEGTHFLPWVLCQAILFINSELALLRQMRRLAAQHCKALRMPMLVVLHDLHSALLGRDIA